MDPDVDNVAIRAANQRFYDAHETRDLAAMEAIWEHSERIVCIHPGWPILRGWRDVMASWQRILAGPARNQFILTNLEFGVDGDLGWVTLDENLMDGPATSTVAATNLFTRDDTGWRMIHHHGSPVLR